MAEYKRILIAGNPVLTSGNFTPDNFEYLKGEEGEKERLSFPFLLFDQTL